MLIEFIDIVDGLNGRRSKGDGIYAANKASGGNVGVQLSNVRVQGHMNGYTIVRGAIMSIRDCWAYINKKNGFNFLSTKKGSGTSISLYNCYSSTNGGEGYFFDGYGYCMLANCAADGNINGYRIGNVAGKRPNSFTFLACGAEGNKNAALQLDKGAHISAVTILGGSYGPNPNHGFILNDAIDVTVVGTKIHTSTKYALDATYGVEGEITLIGVNYGTVGVVIQKKVCDPNKAINNISSNTKNFELSGALIHSKIHQIKAKNRQPNVNSKTILKTNNISRTTISNFEQGIEGQKIVVIFKDNNTIVDFSNSKLKGNNGKDFKASKDDHMECIFDGEDWYCSVNKNN